LILQFAAQLRAKAQGDDPWGTMLWPAAVAAALEIFAIAKSRTAVLQSSALPSLQVVIIVLSLISCEA